MSEALNAAAIAPALHGLRVLLVEDEFLIALDLHTILGALGCIVLGPAPTVAEALDLLAAEQPLLPDAALLDYNLGGVPSTPVARVLAGHGVPFVAVTAYASLAEPVFNGAPMIAKPFQPDQIRDALQRLMQQRQRQRQR